MRVAVMACLWLLSAACTYSDSPITSVTPAPDAALLGQWQIMLDEELEDEPDEEPDIVEVTRTSDGAIELRSMSPSGETDDEPLTLVTADLGRFHYVSLGVADDSTKRMRFLLMRYKIETPDRLQLYFASFERLDDAVKRGWIRGKEVPNRHFTAFELTTEEGPLREFITRHGPSVFSEKGAIATRVAPPTPRRP